MSTNQQIPAQINQQYRFIEQVEIPNNKNHRYFRFESRTRTPKKTKFLKVLSHNDKTCDIHDRIVAESSSGFVNVPDLYFHEGPDDYLLTPHFADGDFRNHINERQESEISLEECHLVVSQLNTALSDLHSNCELIHCDLKPSNILLEKENGKINKVFLNDFDHCVDLKNQFRQRRGYTLKYAAPELLNKAISVEPSVDFWSLGMILYEWITGIHVFDGINDERVNLRLSGELSIDFQRIENTEIRALIATRREASDR